MKQKNRLVDKISPTPRKRAAETTKSTEMVVAAEVNESDRSKKRPAVKRKADFQQQSPILVSTSTHLHHHHQESLLADSSPAIGALTPSDSDPSPSQKALSRAQQQLKSDANQTPSTSNRRRSSPLSPEVLRKMGTLLRHVEELVLVK